MKLNRATSCILLSGIISILTLLILFYYWFGPLDEFFETVMHSLQQAKILGGGYDLKSLILSPFKDIYYLLLPKNILLENVVFLLYFARQRKPLKRFGFEFESFFFWNLSFQVFVLYLLLGTISVVEISFYSLIILSWRFFSLAQRHDVRITIRNLFFMFWCFLSTRFGTNNSMLLDGMGSLVFIWACFIFLTSNVFPSKRKRLFVFLILSALVLSSSLKKASAPYRSKTPIWKHHYSFQTANLNFKFDKASFNYATELKNRFSDAGFRPGDLLLDLTGATPGALLILDANFLGAAWNLGGYPGSDAYFVSGLSQVSCNSLSRAWLLVSEGSSLSLQTSNLKYFNLDLDKNYDLVSSVNLNTYRQESQKIYRPKINVLDLKNCQL